MYLLGDPVRVGATRHKKRNVFPMRVVSFRFSWICWFYLFQYWNCAFSVIFVCLEDVVQPNHALTQIRFPYMILVTQSPQNWVELLLLIPTPSIQLCICNFQRYNCFFIPFISTFFFSIAICCVFLIEKNEEMYKKMCRFSVISATCREQTDGNLSTSLWK